jgi:NAD(P)-dependent dehydrogenase (short-subunit alcohol dehydrogenase family)
LRRYGEAVGQQVDAGDHHDLSPARGALITGVGRAGGLGFAVGQLLAEQGSRVVLTARDVTRADELAARLRERQLLVEALELDVSGAGSVAGCAAPLAQSYGSLDVLINNAAGGFDIEQSVLDADLDIARLALEVNFLGPWRLVQALLPLLKRAPAARIVNVSSAAASLRLWAVSPILRSVDSSLPTPHRRAHSTL